MYTFQKTNISQIHQLLEESKDSFLPTRQDKTFNPKLLMQKFEQNPEFQLFNIVNEHNTPVSYITALPYKPTIISVGPMYVSKNHQGQGLGKKQLQEFINWAKEKHYEEIYAKTWSGNEASKNVFLKLGFQITEEVPNDRINGDSTVKLFLKITE